MSQRAGHGRSSTRTQTHPTARPPSTPRRTTTWRVAATVEVSPCVFLDGYPYERLTNMAQQARANEAQFLEHLILRAEAIYNFQPPVPPPPRVPGGSCGVRRSVSQSCRPSWPTCATLLDHLGILVRLSSSRPAGPVPLSRVQVLAVLARTAQLAVRHQHFVVAALAGPL